MDLVFEKSRSGRRALTLPIQGVESSPELPEEMRRKKECSLPEISELDLVRHYTLLSQQNFNIDTNFYPLGSCTMKYNPRFHELAAAWPDFRYLHPYQPEEQLQGVFELLHELERYLRELTGMDALTLQPAAGAHGEFTGLLLIRAYFTKKGEDRPWILIPDSAHGTNPASAIIAGFRTKKIKTGPDGLIDMEDFKSHLDDKTAALMITNPNTLGLFEKNIHQVSELLHAKGAFLYMDGANFNAIVGMSRPGDFGVDVLHLNLHKTFSTPHGGGGPGAGPVAVKKELIPFLPHPRIEKEGETYRLTGPGPDSIGRVQSFFGNVGVLVRAYCYMKSHSPEDFKNIARFSVLNANYLRSKLKDLYPVPYGDLCMHEFVATGDPLKPKGVRTLDIAKRLLDYGIHAPTVYFPLIVHEALMVEPTETESKETLDRFVEVMRKIYQEAIENPDLLHDAPHTMPVKRLDEVKAARQPVVCCDFEWGE